jgi:Na+-transporting NADH:ubiquinone oxidoreductase subunit NqrD
VLVELDICEPLNDAVVEAVTLWLLDELSELLILVVSELIPELVIVWDWEIILVELIIGLFVAVIVDELLIVTLIELDTE